jgi:hypothetical protein
MIAEAEPFATAGVIVAEVLLGLTRNVTQIERYLSQWETLEPCGFATDREAAAVFRPARAKGIALTTIDTLVAAILARMLNARGSYKCTTQTFRLASMKLKTSTPTSTNHSCCWRG